MQLSSLFFTLALAATGVTASPAYPAPAPAHSAPAVRKEWPSLSKAEQKDYIDAVLCLYKKPSKLPHGLVPGALNRRDDFVAVHINQTFSVHLDAVFLGWHRNFLWLYEQALRDECGYKGYQPYWDWTKSANNISAYPLWDGSAHSISGNGQYDASTGGYQVGPYFFPHGSGGGCVRSGPFVDLELHLGPVGIQALYDQKLPANWTQRHNHCLRRDFNVPVAQGYTNATSVKYLLAAPDIAEFQSRMSGVGTKPPGPHTAGHLQIGMDMFDLFSSPNDPGFFFHHANVDRMWTIWQNRDLAKRQYALNGTNVNYDPPTAKILTLDDTVNWGILGPAKRFRELMSNLKGGFDYVYEDMQG